LYGSSSLAGGHTQTQCAHSIDTHRYRRRSISTHIDTDEGHRYRRKSSLPTKVIVIDESHRYRRKSSLSTKVIVIDASHRYRRVIVIDESSLSTQVIDTDESHRYRRKSSIPRAGGVESDAKLAELRYLGGLARWFPRALVCGRGIQSSRERQTTTGRGRYRLENTLGIPFVENSLWAILPTGDSFT